MVAKALSGDPLPLVCSALYLSSIIVLTFTSFVLHAPKWLKPPPRPQWTRIIRTNARAQARILETHITSIFARHCGMQTLLWAHKFAENAFFIQLIIAIAATRLTPARARWSRSVRCTKQRIQYRATKCSFPWKPHPDIAAKIITKILLDSYHHQRSGAPHISPVLSLLTNMITSTIVEVCALTGVTTYRATFRRVSKITLKLMTNKLPLGTPRSRASNQEGF
jgi:hypothetical protein